MANKTAPKNMKKSRSDASVLASNSTGPIPGSGLASIASLSSLNGGAASSNRDLRTFYIKKKTRFAVRGFEFATGIILLGLLFRLDSNLVLENGLYSAVTYTKVLLVFSLLIALLNTALYLAPIFLKWSSRKLLVIETVFDAGILAFLVISFITFLSVTRAGQASALCPAGRSPSCDAFNWMLTFEVLQTALFTGSVGIDAKAIVSGIWPSSGGMETELDALKRRPSVKV